MRFAHLELLVVRERWLGNQQIFICSKVWSDLNLANNRLLPYLDCQDYQHQGTLKWWRVALRQNLLVNEERFAKRSYQHLIVLMWDLIELKVSQGRESTMLGRFTEGFSILGTSVIGKVTPTEIVRRHVVFSSCGMERIYSELLPSVMLNLSTHIYWDEFCTLYRRLNPRWPSGICKAWCGF